MWSDMDRQRSSEIHHFRITFLSVTIKDLKMETDAEDSRPAQE
jgi:hypothetical protein